MKVRARKRILDFHALIYIKFMPLLDAYETSKEIKTSSQMRVNLLVLFLTVFQLLLQMNIEVFKSLLLKKSPLTSMVVTQP